MKKWSAVQRHAKLTGRTDQMCKKRWVRHLDPRVAQHKLDSSTGIAWTKEEDEAQLHAHVNRHMHMHMRMRMCMCMCMLCMYV